MCARKMQRRSAYVAKVSAIDAADIVAMMLDDTFGFSLFFALRTAMLSRDMLL